MSGSCAAWPLYLTLTSTLARTGITSPVYEHSLTFAAAGHLSGHSALNVASEPGNVLHQCLPV